MANDKIFNANRLKFFYDNKEPVDDFSKLVSYGIDHRVAAKLTEVYRTGKLIQADLDNRALDALKEFPVDGAIAVLNQFLESNLEHVSNKSAFLCGVMKTYRQKSGPLSSHSETRTISKGPDKKKLNAILNRTGYPLDVTTGQRKYGGPPPGWTGAVPPNGCGIFCGRIPKEVYEDELIPLFERCGKIWDLRLMMDPLTNTNRGYAFVTFTTHEAAQKAVRDLDEYEISSGKNLKIKISFPNLRLFIGNIPKSKGKEEILREFSKLTAGLLDVIIYNSPDDKKKNRGFCFLEYENHKSASLAKRRLGTGRIKVWGCDIIVDWADPQEEPDDDVMSKVKVLYVRNLTQNITETRLQAIFEIFGVVERIKKIKDYAFVHFETRENAIRAMRQLNGAEIQGTTIEITLAKPPFDKNKKEEILRAREKRMTQLLQTRSNMIPSPVSTRGISNPRLTKSSRSMGHADYDYDYSGYSCEGYRGGYLDPYDDYYQYEDFYPEFSNTDLHERKNRSKSNISVNISRDSISPTSSLENTLSGSRIFNSVGRETCVNNNTKNVKFVILHPRTAREAEILGVGLAQAQKMFY